MNYLYHQHSTKAPLISPYEKYSLIGTCCVCLCKCVCAYSSVKWCDLKPNHWPFRPVLSNVDFWDQSRTYFGMKSMAEVALALEMYEPYFGAFWYQYLVFYWRFVLDILSGKWRQCTVRKDKEEVSISLCSSLVSLLIFMFLRSPLDQFNKWLRIYDSYHQFPKAGTFRKCFQLNRTYCASSCFI